MSMLTLLDDVVLEGESIAKYVALGLAQLKGNAGIVGYIEKMPALAPIAAKLIGLIPIVGEIETGLEISDLVLQNIGPLFALGKAWHLAPASGDDLARLQAAKGQDL